MSKIVYITGIAGFIGSTLAKRLHSEGYEVIGIDNLSGSDGSNLEGVDFAWEVGDFDKVNKVRADVIVHLAAMTNARDFDEEKMREENYVKTRKLVAKNPDKRIIFASTCLEAKPELNFYASYKHLASHYIEEFNGDYVILKFGNVFGPNQRDWGEEPNVLAAWKKAVEEGKPIRIDGDGSQVRDFIHVDDVCEAIQKTIERPNVTKEKISICTGTQYSIREAAEICYPDQSVVLGERHPLDYDYILQDPRKAKMLLGFTAKRRIGDNNVV